MDDSLIIWAAGDVLPQVDVNMSQCEKRKYRVREAQVEVNQVNESLGEMIIFIGLQDLLESSSIWA